MSFIDIFKPFNINGTFFLRKFKAKTGQKNGQLSHHAGDVPDSDAFLQGLLRRICKGLSDQATYSHPTPLILLVPCLNETFG